MVFIIATTSARVGSDMVMDAGEWVVEAAGDGGVVVVVVSGSEEEGEDRRTRDTKLSRTSNP
jgi:hypothetical protein